jgi:hypothetical protein
MQPKHHETLLVKAYFVVAFLVSALAIFFATEQFATWVKLKSDVLALLPIQLILASLPGYLISGIEARVVWRLTQQDGFFTIYPVSMGMFVGYLLHYG